MDQIKSAIKLFQIIKETQQEKQTLANVEARYADIIKLGTSIKELNDMYIEMAILIEAQVRRLVQVAFPN